MSLWTGQSLDENSWIKLNFDTAMEKKREMENTPHLQLTRRAGLALLVPLVATGFLGKKALSADQPQLLFVQSAADVETADGQIRLKNANPLTLFFSDRPQRVAGHYKLEEWGKLWTEGKDSFLKDHPNAVLSVFEPGKEDATDTVVELLDFKAEGSDLVYAVKVIKGTLPANGGQSSLFIDIIGMPLTPVSYAGAARRAIRY
jgi:hypothetical protein